MSDEGIPPDCVVGIIHENGLHEHYKNPNYEDHWNIIEGPRRKVQAPDSAMSPPQPARHSVEQSSFVDLTGDASIPDYNQVMEDIAPEIADPIADTADAPIPMNEENDEFIFTDEQDDRRRLNFPVLPVNFNREDNETQVPGELPPHLEDFAEFCARL